MKPTKQKLGIIGNIFPKKGSENIYKVFGICILQKN